MEQILEKQPSTSSTVITDAIEISEDSNEESALETGEISFLINILCLQFLFIKLCNMCHME